MLIDDRFQTRGGILTNPVANEAQIRVAERFMRRKGYANMKTEDGQVITPEWFANFCKAVRLPLKFSIGVMVYELRESGLFLLKENGERLINYD